MAPSGGPAVLGVDVGTVRVGIAASDPTRTIASPVESLRRDAGEVMWRRLDAIIAEREVGAAVVGLPRELSGAEGDAAVMARRFADEFTSRTGLAVVWWDERFTSVAAERSLIAQGVRRKQRRQAIDAVAASVMLQSWLDATGRASS